MNYIRHLNAFFTRIKSDDRLTAIHVSLYLALFQYWNFNRFQNPFPVYRDHVMQLSKLGSKNTYHKCIRSLHETGYILYHPAPSKYLPVKISILSLHTNESQPDFKQLNLFSSHSDPLEPHVPHLTLASPTFDTGQVPNLGHSIKQNILKNSVANTPTEIFEKKGEGPQSSFPKGGARRAEDFQGGGNPPFEGVARRAGGVPQESPFSKGGGRRPGDLKEAESFFLQHHSTTEEAQKFFYYNQGKNWMLTDKLPISDWKALARKWLLNTKPQKDQPMDLNSAIQSIYELYLRGERINKLLLPEFADHLQLQISGAVKHEAIQRRINQLSGSNENGHIQLWKAYMQEEFSSDLVINDEPNLLALAKRLAVSKHFQKLKSKGQQHVFSP